MNKRLMCVAFAFLGLCRSLFGANAIMLDDIGVAPADSEIVLGEWHGGFDACLEKANREHIPLFAMWSNTGCSHCEAVYTAIVDDLFVNWRRGNGNIGKIILLLMKGGSQGNGYETWSAGYDWAWGPGHTLSLYPFMAMYWNKEDGTVIRTHAVGEDMTGWTGGESGAANMIARLENIFAGWTGSVASPTEGSTFVVGTNRASRLEAEVGQTLYVDIPLVRTNGVTSVGTNYLTIAAGERTLRAEQPIVWLDGEETMTARVTLTDLGYSGEAGDILTLTLADDTKTNIVASSTITYVSNPQGTLDNPLWFGERSDARVAPALAAGEWTMDLELATNRTARQSGSAYTLVAAVGSLWCPDCKRLTTNLVEKAEFRNWAVGNNVALVQIDAPYGTLDGPTLLSYTETWGMSGAGYLSRKMADADKAADTLARNRKLYSETWNNIYTDNRARLKLPTLLLLDKNARIVARIDDDKLPFDVSAMIPRLDEMIAAASESGEELNVLWSTTSDAVDCPGTKAASISAVDKSDYCRISNFTGRAHVTLSPRDGEKPGKGWLRIVDAGGNMVANAPFAPTETVSVAADIPAAGAYVYVSADIVSQDSPQKFSSTVDTQFPYKLTLRPVNVLTPSSPDISVDATMREEGFLMQVVAGAAYRIEGLAELDDELSKILRKSEATGPDGETLYQGLADADVFLPVSPTVQTLVAKLWQSGEIGFSGAVTRTVEEDGSGPIAVRFSVARTGGTSGEAMVNVVLDDSSTCLPIRYSFNETQLSWASGEEGEKTAQFTLFNDSYYDPDQTLVFKLEPAGTGVVTIPAERNTLSFTIIDDDSPHVGQLAITGSAPGFSSKNAVIAKEGTQVEIQVSRENGMTGEISARLAMFDVKGVQLASSEPLVWAHRAEGALSATFTLPAYLETRRAYIKLVPIGGAAVDYERNMVTVEILPASLPAFSEDMVSESIYRYVRYEKTIALTNGEEAGDGGVVLLSASCDCGPGSIVNPLEGLSVVKTTGALPPGLTAALVALDGTAAFEISGVPTRTGTYRATYRLSQSANGNTIRGGTMSVELEVLAIPLDDKEEESGSMSAVPNPSIARARTFRNLPVCVNPTECGGDATGRLVGLLTLTIPQNGRVSAKYTSAQDTCSYSANGWSDYNPKTGEVKAQLKEHNYEREYDIEVSLDASGSGVARFRNMAGWDGSNNEDVIVELYDPGWSASDSAAAWGGRYTVQLPQAGTAGCDVIPDGAEIAKGDAVLTLKMIGESSISRGRMTFAGYLPDGRSISGSSILLRYGEAGVALPILAGNHMSGMAGELQILPNAAELHTDNGGKNNHFVYPVSEAYPYWRKVLSTPSASSRGACAPASSLLAVRMSLDAFGGYYDGNETLLYDCCISNYGDTNLTFSVAQDGAGVAFVPVVAAIGEHSLTITSTGDANPNNVRLSFSVETGMFSGTFRAYVEDALRVFNFRGVLMPGWGGCEICGPVALPRPVGSGACWYSSPSGEKLGSAVEISKGSEE